MKHHKISRHASIRMNQRGLRRKDLELITQCGTWTGDNEVFLSNRDVRSQIAQLKKELGSILRADSKMHGKLKSIKQRIQDLERLSGCKVILIGDWVASCYRTNKRHQKQILRLARACAA